MSANDNDQRAYVVLGASGGIGSHVSRQLIREGHQVLLSSRSSDHLDGLAAELRAPHHPLDATNFAEVERCFDSAIEEFGRLDGVVNCVGSLLLKPAHITSEDEWQDALAKNLTSAFATVRGAGQTMKAAGGSVVLVASAAARIGLANHEAIAAAKAGVIGLARSAAASYAPRGIRFNAVAPGLVKTKLTRKIWQSERAAAASRSMHALDRLGEPQDVASLITWLLSPSNSWITGEVFSVDGGLAHVHLSNAAI